MIDQGPDGQRHGWVTVLEMEQTEEKGGGKEEKLKVEGAERGMRADR